MRDPRYKHEYLDSPKNAKFEKRSDDDDDDDESDKHLEARDCRYSCLIMKKVFHPVRIIAQSKITILSNIVLETGLKA